mgnify:CR=1 FL=1
MLFCWWREKGGHKEAKYFLKSSYDYYEKIYQVLQIVQV